MTFALRVDLGRRALLNARRALSEIQGARADRQALQHRDSQLVRLSEAEALSLIQRMTVGRLAYIARDGEPDLVPVNYTWRDGTVLIRSGPGPKLQAARRRETVAFEVDDIDRVTRTGSSALVVGRAEVLDPWVPVPETEVWAGGPRRHVIRIVPRRLTGRRIRPSLGSEP